MENTGSAPGIPAKRGNVSKELEMSKEVKEVNEMWNDPLLSLENNLLQKT